jgi:hypothetical protein
MTTTTTSSGLTHYDHAATMRIVGIAASLLVAASALPFAAGASPTATAGIAYVTGGAKSAPEVWVAGANGSSPRKLGEGLGPLLAPDGSTVAVSNESPSGPALSLYPVGGGAPKTYFNLAHATAQAVAWSPDSRYVAVVLSSVHVPSLSGSGLAVIDTQSGTYKMIAKGRIAGASFAPGASDMLAYAQSSSMSFTAKTNVFTATPEGTQTTQITTNGRSSTPVWGARGIAFDHERLRPGYAPLDQIWMMEPNGSDPRQITHVKVGPLVEGLVPLAFSADGTRLAAEYEGTDTAIGYSVSIESGDATQLKVGNQAVSAWGISQDGNSVLISVGGFMNPPSRGKIEQIPFSGGPATVLVGHGDYPSWNE